MILDTTTRSLQIILSTAMTTTNMAITVDYVDLTVTTTVPGLTTSSSNGVTAATILAAPAASTQRKVNSISVYNADSVSKSLIIRINDNGTFYPLINMSLSPLDTLSYTDTNGWSVVSTTAGVTIEALNSTIDEALVYSIAFGV